MAGQAKENLPGGSLKYLFVYLKVRIFKCSYRIYIYIHIYIYVYIYMNIVIFVPTLDPSLASTLEHCRAMRCQGHEYPVRPKHL